MLFRVIKGVRDFSLSFSFSPLFQLSVKFLKFLQRYVYVCIYIGFACQNCRMLAASGNALWAIHDSREGNDAFSRVTAM